MNNITMVQTSGSTSITLMIDNNDFGVMVMDGLTTHETNLIHIGLISSKYSICYCTCRPLFHSKPQDHHPTVTRDPGQTITKDISYISVTLNNIRIQFIIDV